MLCDKRMVVADDIFGRERVDGTGRRTASGDSLGINLPLIGMADDKGGGIEEVLNSHGDGFGIDLSKGFRPNLYALFLGLAHAQAIVYAHTDVAMACEVLQYGFSVFPRSMFPCSSKGEDKDGMEGFSVP